MPRYGRHGEIVFVFKLVIRVTLFSQELKITVTVLVKLQISLVLFHSFDGKKTNFLGIVSDFSLDGLLSLIIVDACGSYDHIFIWIFGDLFKSSLNLVP